MSTPLDRFVSAYVECALWSSTDDDGEPFDAWADVSDIASEALASMALECKDFRDANAELLAHAGDDKQNGHDFWLTRNRHGAGFWDRGYPDEIGRTLTDAAHAYGESNLYLGDDGRIYVD